MLFFAQGNNLDWRCGEQSVVDNASKKDEKLQEDGQNGIAGTFVILYF